MEWTLETTFDLDLPGGTKAVWGQLKGPFDILSEPISDTIKLDVTAPVVDIVSPSKGTTEDETVKLTVSVSDNQDMAPIVEWRLNGGIWTTYENGQKLPLKEGDNFIEVRSQDAAGNMGTSDWEIQSDRGMFVGGVSWLILIVIIVVVAVVGVWYWRNGMKNSGEIDPDVMNPNVDPIEAQEWIEQKNDEDL